MLELEQLIARMACPRDKGKLELRGSEIVCPDGHTYPILDGVPVMLLEEAKRDYHQYNRTVKQMRGEEPLQDFPELEPDTVDPYVQGMVGSTCGRLYTPAHNKLTTYPIPEFPLPEADGQTLLDMGSNWGRWSIAASRKGYDVIGFDVDLEGIRSARRIARQLGISASYIVADSRYLPFPAEAFDVVFSFGVLQHFPKEDVRQTLPEVRRVLKPTGKSVVQMASLTGLRGFYNHVRTYLKRGRRGPQRIDIRYWTWRELRRAFQEAIGPTSVSVDSYLALGIQRGDMHLMLARHRAIVRVGLALGKIGSRIPGLNYLADSIYLESSPR